MSVDAADLLMKQREVEDLQSAQQRAWWAIGNAEAAVEAAKANFNSARYLAEEASGELEAMEAEVLRGREAS